MDRQTNGTFADLPEAVSSGPGLNGYTTFSNGHLADSNSSTSPEEFPALDLDNDLSFDSDRERSHSAVPIPIPISKLAPIFDRFENDANLTPELRPSLRDHRNSIGNGSANGHHSPGRANGVAAPDRRKTWCLNDDRNDSPDPHGFAKQLKSLRINTDIVDDGPGHLSPRLLDPDILAGRRKALRQSRFLDDSELDDIDNFRSSQRDLGYRTLETARFETRFIELLPPIDNATEDLVQGRLVHASLLDAPEYAALSYNWGDTRSEATIVLNDVLIPVGANLEAAMRELRRRGEKLVWIDCLSINQADSSERSFQLLRSGQIYAKAFKVISWLGPAADGSDAAMGFLQQFDLSLYGYDGHSPHMNGHVNNGRWSPDDHSNEHSRTRASSVDRINQKSASKFSVFDALERLFQRPYFERTWIIMEMATGTTVELLCGAESASLDAAEEYMKFVRGGRDPYRRMPDSLRMLLHFRSRETDSYYGESRMSLLHALIASRLSIAIDPRDKIYALLPLTRDAADLVPTPNYVESVETTLVNLATNMVTIHGQTSSMLLACRTSLDDYKSLPTWTPNWVSLREDIIPPWVTSCLEQRRLKRHPRAELPSTTRVNNRTILTIRGVRLEQILSMSGQTQSITPPPNRQITRLPRSRLKDILYTLWETLTDLAPAYIPTPSTSPSLSVDPPYREDESEDAKIYALRAFLSPSQARSPRAAEIAALMFGAYRVQDWVDEYCDTSPSIQALPSSTRRAIKSTNAYARLKSAGRCLGAYRMKLAVCGDPKGGHQSGDESENGNDDNDWLSFRVVYRRAHVGDWIWRIHNCALPVVLRHTPISPGPQSSPKKVNGVSSASNGFSNGTVGLGIGRNASRNREREREHSPRMGNTHMFIGEVVLRDIGSGERHWLDGTGWVEEDFEREGWENVCLI